MIILVLHEMNEESIDEDDKAVCTWVEVQLDHDGERAIECGACRTLEALKLLRPITLKATTPDFRHISLHFPVNMSPSSSYIYSLRVSLAISK